MIEFLNTGIQFINDSPQHHHDKHGDTEPRICIHYVFLVAGHVIVVGITNKKVTFRLIGIVIVPPAHMQRDKRHIQGKKVIHANERIETMKYAKIFKTH